MRRKPQCMIAIPRTIRNSPSELIFGGPLRMAGRILFGRTARCARVCENHPVCTSWNTGWGLARPYSEYDVLRWIGLQWAI